ncbi:FIST N-terminal domain-containing protein [Candidatus Thiothrix sp. Deng01]|uniref:FIST N-terminal domain-containing protein n=1 Tax=Candidatus Thiothrix phosphatis TaxID=3112415 RepID=A0ABU6CWE8_9GAMM|nr:FIST N-terminal domain-containing protein [Candidatus Thiothrix sp. Deng01]MEB4590407.1 FIST N-terminal domain-containing protein [Candidatus Thiothrix sp. Deng01]
MITTLTSPQIYVDDTGSCDGLFQHIGAAINAGAQSLLLLACDANAFSPLQLDERLRNTPVPVFGGIFPQIVVGERKLEQGSVVCGLPVAASVHYVERLSDPDEDYLLQTQDLAADIPQGSALVTLVDGLSKRISALLESLYEVMGDGCQYVGGGAGSLSFEQKPCLFSNQGLLKDCAQITVLDLPVSVGIRHGWHKFAGPFFVTGAHDNTIVTLDYRPAFEVYREVVEADSGKRFNTTAFFDLAKAYPFGLDRLKGDVVVRDPLLHVGECLVCVGEVPANHMIYILKGEDENLLEASRQCALDTARAHSASLALLFDCISRTLFLQGRFSEEIHNIHSRLPEGVPLVGVLSLGEIADAGNACLEFFNKTIVLGVLAEQEGVAA